MINFKTDKCCFEHKIDDKDFSSVLSRHMHSKFELLYVVGGSGTFNLDGNVYDIGPCDLIITPAFCYHFMEIDQSKVYDRIVFNFSADYFSSDYSEIFDKVKVVNLANHRDILGTFDRILNYEQSNYNQADLEKVVNLLVEELLLQLKNTRFDGHTSKSLTALTSKIIAYIDSHLGENIYAEDIANALHVSKSHLQNTFIKTMKVGVKTYIIMKKMEKARALLKEGKRTIEVAEMLGYCTYSSFYKSYLKAYGEAPKDTF